jgi:hypothetical protein
MTDKKLWRNRKERKEWARRLQSEDPGLEVVHSHAAGIDVGNSMHYVAVRPDRDPQPVRRFECFTADLHRLADWLQSCGVKTVAMQSTGVYWIPIYEILEERGIRVYLVNARHTKNLPGRKSDVQESQRLLNNSFQPPSEIRVLRTYWRQRGEHVHGAATCVQRMQKALTQMNVQLASLNPTERLVHGPRLLFAAAGCAPVLVDQGPIAGSSRRFARRHYGIVHRCRPGLWSSMHRARLVHEIASDTVHRIVCASS